MILLYSELCVSANDVVFNFGIRVILERLIQGKDHPLPSCDIQDN